MVKITDPEVSLHLSLFSFVNLDNIFSFSVFFLFVCFFICEAGVVINSNNSADRVAVGINELMYVRH